MAKYVSMIIRALGMGIDQADAGAGRGRGGKQSRAEQSKREVKRDAPMRNALRERYHPKTG